MTQHTIANEGLSATILAEGAELCSLRLADGTEFLWQAAPIWPRHAPVLFPIVGRLKGDTLRHQGRSYRLTQHGFARDRLFEWVERTPTSCRLALVDDEQTRAMYPFPFRLELAYEIAGNALTQSFVVTNPGGDGLPASFGAHPAFVWPLRHGLPKDAHTLIFSDDETTPIRRLASGLLLADPVPNPVERRTLRLSEGLFAHDALVFDRPASRSVRYAAPGTASITVAWSDMPQLGVWSKPADFVCIEPWHGLASPDSYDGEFTDKPGVAVIAPGESLTGHLVISISSNPD